MKNLLLAFLLASTCAFAQTADTTFEQYIDYADSAYSANNESLKAYRWYAKAYTIAENGGGFLSEEYNNYMAPLSYRLGLMSYGFGLYEYALVFLELSLEYYRSYEKMDGVVQTIPGIAMCYQAMRERNINVDLSFDGELETQEIYYSIIEPPKKSGDDWLVKINGGIVDGIYSQSVGTIYGVQTDKYVERAHTKLGDAKVEKLDSNTTVLRVSPVAQTDSSLLIYQGDMGMMLSRVPKREFKSLVWELACKQVIFKNNERNPMYDYRQFLRISSGELEILEGNILEIMLRDIYETCDMLDDLEDKSGFSNVFVDVIPKGRFKGLTTYEAMRKTNKNDVRAYLDFVNTYPAKYMGIGYKVNETYATWVLNSAPMGYQVFLEDVLALQSEADYISFSEKHEESLRDEDFLNYLNVEAENTADEKGRFLYAKDVVERGLKLATILEDTSKMGWAYFGLARIYDIAGKSSDSAIYYYESAIPYFEKVADEKGKSYCLNNLGSFAEDNEEYEKANQYYREAYKTKLAMIKSATTEHEDIAYSLAKSCLGIGSVEFVVANYDSAVAAFNRGIYWSDSVDGLQGLKFAATLQTEIAKVYKKRGQYDEAFEIYTDQMERYAQLGWQEQVLDARDNAANVMFKQGKYEAAFEEYYSVYQQKLELEDYTGAGFSLSNCAQAMWNLSQLDSAIALHNQAILLREKDFDTLGTAFSVTKLASLYKELGRPEEAKEYYNRALNIYQAKNDELMVAELAVEIGDYFYDLKNFSRSLYYYQFADSIYANKGMKSEMALVYANKGFVYQELKNFAQAKEFHQKSLTIRTEINERQNIMYSLVNVGILYSYNDFDYDTALVLFNQALELARETGSKTYEAFCYHSIGNAYMMNAKTSLAEDNFKKALAIYKDVGNVQEQTAILNALGGNAIQKGDFHDALDYYHQSEKLARDNGLRLQIANVMSYLSEYYYYTGEFDESFAVIDTAFEIYTAMDNDYGLSNTYIVLGNTYNLQGRGSDAVAAYQKADSIFATLKDPLGQATALNNTATIKFFQGDYTSALRLLNQCLGIFDSTGVRSSLLNSVYTNLGEIYMEKGIWDESEKWLEKGIALGQEMDAQRSVWGDKTIYAKLLLKQEKYAEAATLLEKCHSAFVKSDEKMAMAETATSLGKAYVGMGETAKAKKSFSEALEIYRAIGSKKMIWEPLYQLALLEKSENHTLASVAYLKEAVDTLEILSNDLIGDPSSKKLFAKANDKKNIYQSLIAQLVKAGDVQLAWTYQEKLNVYGLEEQTRGDGTRGGQTANSEEFALAELELKVDGIYSQLMKEKAKPASQRSEEKIAELEKRMSVASENYQNFFWDLVDNGVISNDFSNSINPEELDQMRFDLDPDIIVLEYLVTDDQLIIFAASADTLGAKVIDIPKENIESYVNRYYNLLVNQAEFAAIDQAADQLYNALISPVESMLSDKKKIAFIPTGVLYKLPFQSLGKANESGMKYIVEDYAVFYLNDIRSTMIRQTLDASSANLLAFGNADASLAYAEKEVGMIQQTFPEAVVYIKKDAREDLAKANMNDYKIVHFATHGNLDPINFNNSYLTMAPNVELGEDGQFTMKEINRIRTLRDCQLIVLSACNTAVNDEQLDGWVNNPAKAFLRKGAKSAVASLWSVDDAATGDLMQHFYKNLKAGQTKLDALQNAQRALIQSENFTHPYFWAAFELIGQWQ